MYEQVEKKKVNKSRAVAKTVAQNNSNVKQNFGLVDNRPLAVKQRKLQNIASVTSSVSQLNKCKDVVQMVRTNPLVNEQLIKDQVYMIGGKRFTVKSNKMSLGSVDHLLDHMAGEKPATWGGQAKGGHLKSTMDANTSKIDDQQAKITWVKNVNSNTPHSRPKAKWRWSSIDATENTGKNTGVKMSTMWPTGWTRSDLSNVFNNSYLAEEQKGGHRMYLSGQGSNVNKYFSYIHLSDGGSGTAYPETL